MRLESRPHVAVRTTLALVAIACLLACKGDPGKKAEACSPGLRPVDEQMLRHAFQLGFNDAYKTSDKISRCVFPSPANPPADTEPFLQRWKDLCVASYDLVVPGRTGFDPAVRQAFLDGSRELAAIEASRPNAEPGLRYEMQERAFEVFCRNGYLERIVSLADRTKPTSVAEVPPGFLAIFDCQDRLRADPEDLKECLAEAGQRYFPRPPK